MQRINSVPDAALVRASKEKLKKDIAAENDAESKDLLKEEEAELAAVVGSDTSSLVSKFFKQ